MLASPNVTINLFDLAGMKSEETESAKAISGRTDELQEYTSETKKYGKHWKLRAERRRRLKVCSKKDVKRIRKQLMRVGNKKPSKETTSSCT